MSQDRTTNENNSIQQNQEKCQYCGGFFQNKRGVNIHISRAHRDIHRNKISEKYKTTKYHSNPSDHDTNNHCTSSSTCLSSQNDEINNLFQKYKEELSEWTKKFSKQLDDSEFDSHVENFSVFLSNSIKYLPGPKHPASKYYEARKKHSLVKRNKNHKQSSNPERANKRSQEKRKFKYNYELTQFLYYNQRRKAIRQVLDTKAETCTINTTDIHDFFSETFSTINLSIREDYPQLISDSDLITLDDTFDENISKEEILQATRNIAVDTAPGPDHVLVRAIKNDIVADIISKIATHMLKTGKSPECLKRARTILIFKSGDNKNLSNWRPITICSVIRRVIERVLDSRLRTFVNFNEHQRGFTNMPGTLINTSILGSILNSAKKAKEDVTVIFLDIRKAFDNIGHDHLNRALRSAGVPTKLADLIINLQTNNLTQIETQKGKTKPITLLRGVMQGSPLSPSLYNIATNHILDDLTEESISSHYGKILCSDLPPLTVLGFADDTAIIGKDKNAALELTRIAIQRFAEIGLEVNPRKCIGICIKGGKLAEETLNISNSCKIHTLNHNDSIKYLGVTFSNTLCFDPHSTIQNLRKKLDLLASSALLKPEQKFQILNTSICSSLIYQFQTTGPNNISKQFLNDSDKIIKSTLKEILQLPTDIPDHMLYSDMKYKGLGLFKAGWEAYLQHLNSCKILVRSKNPYVLSCRNLGKETAECIRQLELTGTTAPIKDPRTGILDSRKIRKILREREFDSWTQLPQKGLGIELFKEYTPANSWIRHRNGLTSSEWREAIKMTAHVSAVRSLPGRTQDNTLCRRCHRETETLAHVLGFCPFGELLRNSRHHGIRSTIAEELRSQNFRVYEEVHCLATGESTRRIDMLAIPPNSNVGYILDPTVRFEKFKDQPEAVNEEKKKIYLPTVPFFKNKYGLEDIEVTGLMVGARGTIPHHFVTIWTKFGLQKEKIKDIAIAALRGSIALLRHHLYQQ